MSRIKSSREQRRDQFLSVVLADVEEWRGIDGCPNHEVSNLGRVRHKSSQFVLSPRIHKDTRYKQVYIATNDRRRRNVYIHQAVAQAFLGKCPEGLEINHIDYNKGNNRVSNLEYVTHSQNNQHAQRFGHGVRKLTTQQVEEIRRLRGTMSLNQLARMFHVTKGNIVFITTGKTRRES